MNLFELFSNCVFKLIKGNHGLFPVVACNKNALVVFNVARSKLDSYGNALHLIFRVFPAGAVVAVIKLDSDVCSLEPCFKLPCLFKYACLVLSNGNNNRLNGSDRRRKNKTVVVAVGHDDCADKSCCHAPGGLVRIFKLVFAALILNAESLCKAVAEVMRGSGLESLSIVHERFNRIG